jgi:hypothetical protein
MDKFLRLVGRAAAVLLLPVGVILALGGLLVGAALPVALEPGQTLAGMRQQPELYPALAPLTLAALAEALPEPASSLPENTSPLPTSEPVPGAETATLAVRLEDNAATLAAGGEVDADALLAQIAADASALAEAAAVAGGADLAETARALASTAANLPPDVLVETAGQVAAGVVLLPAPSAETPPTPPPSGPLTLAGIIAALPTEAWAGLARQIAPPDWIEAQIGESLAAARRGEVAALDTETLRAALTGQPGTLLAAQIITLARTCTAEETAAWAQGLAVALCHPVPEGGAATQVEAALRETLAGAAEGFTGLDNPFAVARLRSPLALTGPSGAVLADWLQDEAVLALTPELLVGTAIALFGAPLVLIALLVLLGTRSLEWWVIWSGLVGLRAGGLILLGASQADFLVRALMDWLALDPTLSAEHALAARLIEGTLRGLALQIPVALYGVLVWVLIGGGLLVFLGLFARRLLPIEEE